MKTINFSRLIAWGGLCASLSLSSCQSPEVPVVPQSSSISVVSNLSTEEKDVLRTDFAKSLAKALRNESLREFLKNEAVQKFDGDHDVFFRKVKDSKVDGINTAGELITNVMLNGSSGSYINIINNLPLLNILVPTLNKASAESWNTKTDIPWVAVMNSESWTKEVKKLIAYDAEGNEHILDKFNEPDKLVLVVQDSERIIVEKKAGSNARVSQNKYLFSDEDSYYYSPFFQQEQKTNVNSNVHTNGFPPGGLNSTPYSYALFNNRDCERDILYKNTSDASYNSQYPYSAADVKEKLRYLQFSSNASLANAADGWTEQTLEIRFTLFYGAIQPARVESQVSGTFVSTNDLMYSDGTPKKYELGNIDLIHWDKGQVGDVIKISAIEFDNGSVTTETFSFGTKFSAGVNVGVPVPGVTLTANASNEITLGAMVQISSTNNSEVLGDANFGFCEDVTNADAGFNNGYIKLTIFPAVPGYYY